MNPANAKTPIRDLPKSARLPAEFDYLKTATADTLRLPTTYAEAINLVEALARLGRVYDRTPADQKRIDALAEKAERHCVRLQHAAPAPDFTVAEVMRHLLPRCSAEEITALRNKFFRS